MDIVVTIPKGEAKNIDKEQAFAEANDNNVTEFWKIGKKPVKLEEGNKVYFVEGGKITCYQIFKGYEMDPVCEVTDRIWGGLNLVLEYPPIDLKKPIPMKGFRGFRYIELDNNL